MQHNRGFTLVELMIGLLLASLLAITMLALFKQINFMGLNTAEDAEYEAQVEIGLLTMQRLVTNAGYGSGKDDDVVIGSYDSRRALLWRYRIDDVSDLNQIPENYIFECRGFGVSLDGIKQKLILLKAPCTTEHLVDDAWSELHPIATVKREDGSQVFSFDLVPGACVPYGIYQGGPAGNIRLVIEGLRKYDYNVPNKRRLVCFSNIKAP